MMIFRSRISLVIVSLLFYLTGFSQAGKIVEEFNMEDFGLGNGDGFFWEPHCVDIQQDQKIVVGGNFKSYNQKNTEALIRLNEDGTIDKSFQLPEGFSGWVNAVLIQPDQKILVGGTFLRTSNNQLKNLIRFNSDGTLDESFDLYSNFQGTINSLTIQPDGKILAAGKFNSLGSGLFSCIVRLNHDGSLDSSFSTAIAYDNTIYSTALQDDGKIIVGGSFTRVQGAQSSGIARLEVNGARDLTFNVGAGFDNQVTCVVVRRGYVYAGGLFGRYKGTLVHALARLKADGSLDLSFPSVFPNLVYGVSAVVFQSDGRLLAFGGDEFVEPDYFNSAVRINLDDTIDTTFNSGPTVIGKIYSAAVNYSDEIITVGIIPRFDNYRRKSGNIVKLKSNGDPDTLFNKPTGFDGICTSVLVDKNNSIIASGNFKTYNGVISNGIIKINSSGQIENRFLELLEFDYKITAVTIDSLNNLYVAVEGIEALDYRIYKFRQDGTRDTTFDAPTYIWGIRTLSVQSDGKLLAGGDFSLRINNLWINRLLRLNADGSIDPSFFPAGNFAGSVNTVVVQADGKILVGGAFTRFNNVTVNRIVRFFPNSQLDTSFEVQDGFDGAVNKLVLLGEGKILAIGEFSRYQDAVRPGIARLDQNGYPDYSFRSTSNSFSTIKDVAVQPDGKYVIVGILKKSQNASVNYIARLHNNGDDEESFYTGFGFNGQANAVGLSLDGKLIIGGEFTAYDEIGKNRIAALHVGCLAVEKVDFIVSVSKPYTWKNGVDYYDDHFGDRFYAQGDGGCDTILILNLTVVEGTEPESSRKFQSDADHLYSLLPDNHTERLQNIMSPLVANSLTEESNSFDYKKAGRQVDNFSVKIYPNPTYGDLILKFQGVVGRINVKLLDKNGNLLLSNEEFNTDLSRLSFNVPAGVYFLEIDLNGNPTISRKVIKI
jgi:uncharacterized delta-60 repeat protein